LHNALEQAGQARCAEVVNLILDNAKTCAPNDAKALTKGVSIRDMKLTMIALDVDCRDCVEKPELIDVCICVLFDVCAAMTVLLSALIARLAPIRIVVESRQAGGNCRQRFSFRNSQCSNRTRRCLTS
jgi:hypothetical protein